MAKTKMSNPPSLAREREDAFKFFGTVNGWSNPPSNHRNASNSAVNRPLDLDRIDTDPDKKNTRWHGITPTRISTPATAVNPYSGGRMSDNLHEKPAIERTGNMSRAPILGSDAGQKRRKTEQGGHPEFISSMYFSKSAEAGSSRGFRPKAPHSHKKPEIIEVPDDGEEDLGQQIRRTGRSSPDPIDSISNEDKAGLHPFERPSPPRESSRDGPSTTRMHNKLKSTKGKTRDIGVEPVSALSDEVEEFSPPPEPGFVKLQIEKIEQSVNPMVRPPFDTVKRVNLLKEQRGSVRGGMKPKFQPEVRKPALKDPQATSPSGYRNSANSKRPVKGPTQVTAAALPLEGFTLGLQLFQSSEDVEYWLHFQEGTSEFRITTGIARNFKNFHGSDLVKDLEYTSVDKTRNSASPIAIVRFNTFKLIRNNRRSPLTAVGFKAGAPDARGFITFKFRVDGANWQNSTRYERLVNQFRSQFTNQRVLDDKASSALWKHAYNEASLSSHMEDTSPVEKLVSDGDEDSHSLASIPSSSVQKHPVMRHSINTDVQVLATSRDTRSNRRQRKSPPEDPDELLLVYPFGGPGAVNITRGDLKRFEPNEFLNDTLIEFGLKLWLSNLRDSNSELADKVHIFSSFFYKKISVKDKEQGYQSVRKWTSKIDIFSKKYLIVPINEHVHWYLAIICNPEYVLRPPPDSNVDIVKPMTRKRKRESETFQQTTGPQDEPDPQSAATTDSIAVHETASSASRTASAPPSVAGSASGSLGRSPKDEVIPDSENEMGLVPTQHSDETKGKDENEVEQLLGFKLTCSVTEPTEEPTDRRPKLIGVTVPERMYTADLQLQYAPSPSLERMEIDRELDFPVPQNQDIGDGSALISSAPPKTLSLSVTAALPASFYSTVNLQKGKEKADEPMKDVPIESPEEDESSTGSIDPTAEQTYIFTFDSLGSRHPKACTVLSDYLIMEAKDKKGIEQASKACPRMALVPYQPNYCDCGIYLLHFVAKFMEDPLKFTHLILTRSQKGYNSTDRAQDWDHSAVGTMRDNLMSRSLDLSEQWKAQKQAAARAAVDGAITRPASVVEDSDDDIIVADPPSPSQAGAIRPKPRPKAKVNLAMKETRGKVSRLRDGKTR